MQIVSVDERPSLNNSMPIHPSKGVSSTSPTLPVVTYFRKMSTQDVFDTIELTVAGDLAALSSKRVHCSNRRVARCQCAIRAPLSSWRTVLDRCGSQPCDQLVGRLNSEQLKVVPVLLFHKAMRQNKNTSRFKFSLAEVDEKPDKTNQLNACFQFDPNTCDMFFKCK